MDLVVLPGGGSPAGCGGTPAKPPGRGRMLEGIPGGSIIPWDMLNIPVNKIKSVQKCERFAPRILFSSKPSR